MKYFISLLIFYSFALAQTQIPTFDPNVVDPYHYLTEQDKKAVNIKMAQVRNNSNIWGAVYILKRLNNESIEELAERVFSKWELGQKNIDNGLLLVLVMEERKSRIEVGYGLEGEITDFMSKYILDQKLAPYMRNNDIKGGIIATFDFLAKLEEKNAMALKEVSFAEDEEFNFERAFIGWAILLVLIWILAPFKNWFNEKFRRKLFEKHPELPGKEFTGRIKRSGDLMFAIFIPVFLTINPGIFIFIFAGMVAIAIPVIISVVAIIFVLTLFFSTKKFHSKRNYLAYLEAEEKRRQALIAKGHLEKLPSGDYQFTKAYYASRRSSSSSSSRSSSSSSSGGGRSGGGGASSSW